ncbi:MAG TPA: glycosyltransferase family 2 protein [Verrucomicrobiae bacterium]|jgi:glycosyltransferase involved in cell wall biosynthesis
MKVSILIPVYNGGEHLAECLDSVLMQDFPGLEILIADDGSTDGSPGIIKSYADRDDRIRWWKNPGNLGMVGNFNACIREARSDYIKFVLQDDKLLSASAVRLMVEALDGHPSAVLVGSRQHVTGVKSKSFLFLKKPGLYHGKKIIVNFLEHNSNFIGQPTLTLFRKSGLKQPLDSRFTGHLDYALWCQLLEQGDFVYLDETLGTWRVHKNQQTAIFEKNKGAHYETLSFMETYYAKPWLREMATDRMLFAQIYYLRKKYGADADRLTSAMMSQLSPRRYAWQWLKHKVSRPMQQLARKLRRE